MKPVHEQSLWAISWPVMLTLAVGISGPLIDSWFLSRISDSAAAGVGATLPIFMLAQTILNSLGQAGAGIAGQYLGARKARLAQATFALLLVTVMGGGIALGAFMAVFSPVLVSMLGLHGEIAQASVTFLRIIGIGFAGRALLSVLGNILAARGLTRWNLWSSIAVVAINTLANGFLAAGWFGLPSFGVEGVAWATLLSWALSGCVTLLWMGWRLGFVLRMRDVRLGWRKVASPLLRIGLPSMVEPISYMLFQLILSAQVVRLGDVALTARVYAANLANLPVLFSYGLAFGAQILVSHLVGAGDFARADKQLRTALAWACGLAFVGAVANALLSPITLGWFTTNAVVLALGVSLLRMDALLQPAKAANLAITFALRAAGDSRFPAVVGSALMWTVGLGACLFLGRWTALGVLGIWLGMTIDEWVRAGINWKRWRSGIWQSKGVVSNP